jgi:hypothetical protein
MGMKEFEARMIGREKKKNTIQEFIKGKNYEKSLRLLLKDIVSGNIEKLTDARIIYVASDLTTTPEVKK